MNRKNKVQFADRVARAAEAAFAAQRFVGATDVLVGIGWLDPERWSAGAGQIDCLETAVQANLSRVSEAMRLFRSWANAKGLFASPTEYVARTPRRESAALQPKRRCRYRGVRIAHIGCRRSFPRRSANASRKRRAAPGTGRCPATESGVEMPSVRRAGDLLMMEDPGPACLRCVGLDDLEYLPAGDALLTRRAKASSARVLSWCVSAGPAAATSDRSARRAAGPGGRAAMRESRPSAIATAEPP